jgi:hypothetical protein
MKKSRLFKFVLAGILCHSTLAIAAPGVSGTVSGKVTWSKKITEEQRKLPASAVLYIFARKAGEAKGPPMAVRRIPQPITLPVEFSLSAADSMMPGTPFEGPMQITARISKSGAVIPVQPGDIEGSTQKPIKTGTQNINVELADVK